MAEVLAPMLVFAVELLEFGGVWFVVGLLKRLMAIGVGAGDGLLGFWRLVLNKELVVSVGLLKRDEVGAGLDWGLLKIKVGTLVAPVLGVESGLLLNMVIIFQCNNPGS